MELLENNDINKHVIQLLEGEQPSYNPIYSLGLIELETLKAYIETYLKTGFIWPSKSSARTTLILNKKLDGSFCLYINYRGFNNLTIKNWQPLHLIGKSLDWLGCVKRFIQLNLTSAYYQMRIWEGDE